MKKYIFDDNGVEDIGGVKCKLILSVIHWESTDPEMGEPESEIGLERIGWTKDRIWLELTMGEGIKNICPIELRTERVYPDGKTEIIQQFYLDPVAAYALYLHLKEVDEHNPDRVFW